MRLSFFYTFLGSLQMTNAHIIEIACGSNHSMSIDDNGLLYTWGKGTKGQLGYGKFTIPLDNGSSTSNTNNNSNNASGSETTSDGAFKNLKKWKM